MRSALCAVFLFIFVLVHLSAGECGMTECKEYDALREKLVSEDLAFRFRKDFSLTPQELQRTFIVAVLFFSFHAALILISS